MSKQVPKLDYKLDEPLRPARPEFLVVSLLSNLSPCGVEYRVEAPLDWRLPWHGGFVEKCKKAIYDVSGRVYASSHPDAKNLIAIPHEFLGSRLRVYVDAM